MAGDPYAILLRGIIVRHVLVTGGAGFLGTALVRRLLLNGARVTATFHRRQPATLEGASWIEAELSRPGALADRRGYDAIVHTAASLPTDLSVSQAEAELNRRLDDAVLDLATRRRVPLVYASTTAVYGPRLNTRPVDETAPLAPAGPYGEHKALSERWGREAGNRHGFPFVALRINAPYGPDQRQLNVMRIFVERAVHGDDLLYHGSGSREQDFTFIDDLAEACELGLTAPPGLYNIAGGAPITMAELAREVATIAGLGRDRVRASGNPDPQDGWRARFDLSKARDRLRWTPRTPLRQGIEQMVAAYRAKVSREERSTCGSL